MHHLMLANDIAEEAQKQAKRTAVKAITLQVGELAKATPHQIKEGLAHINDWDVTIIPVNAVVKCKCGNQGRPKIVERAHDFIFFECPVCGEIPKVLEGDEIKLINIETED